MYSWLMYDWLLAGVFVLKYHIKSPLHISHVVSLFFIAPVITVPSLTPGSVLVGHITVNPVSS